MAAPCFRAYLPKEHGGWFLFLTPLAVGLAVAWQWNRAALTFIVASLALFLIRPPLELALKVWRGARTRDHAVRVPALHAWLLVYGALIALTGGSLLFLDGRWGLIPLGAIGAGLIGLQLWAANARLARTLWSEVIGTAGLSLAAAGAHYAAAGAWSVTAGALWLLMAVSGVGGVLYSRWRLRRRRLAARIAVAEAPAAPPRVSVLAHYASGLALVLFLAAAGWTPPTVIPLYAVLLARVAIGTRPRARPDRTVLAIGLEEGIVTLVAGAWIVATYRL
jgi:hypothetical protein